MALTEKIIKISKYNESEFARHVARMAEMRIYTKLITHKLLRKRIRVQYGRR